MMDEQLQNALMGLQYESDRDVLIQVIPWDMTEGQFIVIVYNTDGSLVAAGNADYM
jgi:hypothetical protein